MALAGSREVFQGERLVATIRNCSNHKIDLLRFTERVNDDRPDNRERITGYGFRAWRMVTDDEGRDVGRCLQIAFEPSEAREAAMLLTRICLEDDAGHAKQQQLLAHFDAEKGDWKAEWKAQMEPAAAERGLGQLEREVTADMKKPLTLEQAEREHDQAKGAMFRWLYTHKPELPFELFRLYVRAQQLLHWVNELGEQEPEKGSDEQSGQDKAD